jgi:ribosomal-protein-alanine N-acetyltransferase
MQHLVVSFLSEAWLPQIIELDALCFGGLWNEDGYRREIDSPNSDLIFLRNSSAPTVVPCPALESQTQENPSQKNGKTDVNRQVNRQTYEQSYQRSPNASSVLGISCSWAIVDEAHITLLGVHPSVRRQGLGMLMLWVQFALARNRGMKRATLEVRSSNTGAIALYQRFGFKQAGIRKRYYQDTGEDALILWRSGLQEPAFQTELDAWKAKALRGVSHSGWTITLEPSAINVR